MLVSVVGRNLSPSKVLLWNAELAKHSFLSVVDLVTLSTVKTGVSLGVVVIAASEEMTLA